jgi:hypothetical protein
MQLFFLSVESNSMEINTGVKTSMLRGLCGQCPVISLALDTALESNPTRGKRIAIAVCCFIDYTGRNFGQVSFLINIINKLINKAYTLD